MRRECNFYDTRDSQGFKCHDHSTVIKPLAVLRHKTTKHKEKFRHIFMFLIIGPPGNVHIAPRPGRCFYVEGPWRKLIRGPDLIENFPSSSTNNRNISIFVKPND